MPQSGGDDSTASTRLLIFCWAFAILYHQTAYRESLATPLDIVVTSLAALLLVRPTLLPFVALAVAQLLLVGQQLPNVYNHWYVVALANLGIVLAAVVAVARARRSPGHVGAAELLPAFGPAARWYLVFLYFLTGWHKLNRDFLTPDISCASVLLDQMAARLGGITVPPALGVVAIAATLLVELGVPIALLFVRTRTPAVLVALAFHLAMAVTGYARFSAAGVALLLCFVAPATHRHILATSLLTHARYRTVLVCGLLASTLVEPLTEVTWLFGQLALTAWIGWVVLRDGTTATLRAPLRQAGDAWLPFAAPLLLLCSGIAPYFGLQTDRALSMYSNLRTEGGITNHLVVPSSWQHFPYQRDLVSVHEAGGRTLRPLVTNGLVVPFEELRARATESIALTAGPLSVWYGRGGVVYRVEDLRHDSALALPVSRLHRKFLRFRPVEERGPRRCSV